MILNIPPWGGAICRGKTSQLNGSSDRSTPKVVPGHSSRSVIGFVRRQVNKGRQTTPLSDDRRRPDERTIVDVRSGVDKTCSRWHRHRPQNRDRQAVVAERRKYLGSESMGWDGKGAGGGGPLTPRGSGVTPRKIYGQNPAFWLVLGKKMCSSVPYDNGNVTTCHYWGWG